MPEMTHCPKCGTRLSPGLLGNVCPNCALQAAFELPVQAESATTLAGRRFGNYELLEEIARGGMGIVYKARQVTLERIVAVKLLLFGPMANADVIRRFRVEAVAAGSLQHPNIVAIHEVGIHNDQHFLVMDYVDGPNLARFTHGQSLLPRRAAAYVKTIAEAIHYAHERGILHRDLKPSNVLIDSKDEPRVTDFGLARRIEGDSSLTITGQVIGSPNYMPPEQAAGCCSRGPVSARSDVYGLGAILYDLVTGRPPFQGESITDTLHQVLNNEPVALRLLNPSVPLDLQTICIKCLQKEPDRRYASAKELAQELHRFLVDEPINARPVSRIERALRLCWRRPALSGAIALTVIAVGVSIGFALEAHRTEHRHMQEKRQNALEKALVAAWTGSFDEAEDAIRRAELAGATVGEVRLLRGQVAFHRSDYAEAIQHLEQAAALTPKSVAAQAVLAMAYPRAGYWSKTETALHAMEHMTLSTFEDYLFKALAQSDWDPEVAVVTLDQAVRRRPAGITRLFCARVQTDYAMMTGNPAAINRALHEADVAKEILPENVAVLVTSLKANQVAAGIFKETEQHERSAAAIQRANADMASLRRYSTNAEAVFARARYLIFREESDQVLAELKRFTPQFHNHHVNQLLAFMFYERGDFQSAHQEISRKPHESESGDFVRGFILAELTNGPALALEEFKRVAERHPTSVFSLHSQNTLRLLGRKREAVEFCHQLRSKTILLPPYRHKWWSHILDYNSDLLSADELLKLAGESRWNQCEANYFIAMTRLAEGDRVAAQIHFRHAMATGVFDFFEFAVSRAFLSRMRQNPDWPPWIPQKNEAVHY